MRPLEMMSAQFPEDLQCPKCEQGYFSQGPKYHRDMDGFETLRYACNICGYEHEQFCKDDGGASLTKHSQKRRQQHERRSSD